MARPRQIVKASGKQAFLRWINYGFPGCGKTQLAGTSPKPLFIANNKDEIIGLPEESDADVWEVKDVPEALEAVEFLAYEGHKEYDFAWLDNGTLLQDQNMLTIMADLVAAKPHRDELIPDKAEYLRNQTQLKNLVGQLFKLPMHVGITAHVMTAEEDPTDEETEMIKLPMFQGGKGDLSQRLCGTANLVTYMSVQTKGSQSRRKLQTGLSDRYYAKDRFTKLPATMLNPTVDDVINGIFGSKKAVRKRPAKKAPAKRRASK